MGVWNSEYGGLTHKNFTGNNVHTPYFREYADAAARTADSGFTVDQVNKVALQESDSTEWLLTDESPITWVQLGAAGAVSKVVKTVRAALVFDSAASINIGTAVPLNARVLKAVINVTEAFDGAVESTITLGDAGDPDRFCETTEADLSTIGVYEIENYYNYGSATQLTGTYVRDGATAGAAAIEIIYSIE